MDDPEYRYTTITAAVTETTNEASCSNTATTVNRHNDENDYSSNQYHQYPDVGRMRNKRKVKIVDSE
jgi:hypothetical protein